jgi:hypothetical protein
MALSFCGAWLKELSLNSRKPTANKVVTEITITRISTTRIIPEKVPLDKKYTGIMIYPA